MSQSIFVIGDVQGCYDQLVALIAKIDAIDPQARLLFAGDLVNRGPKSLETLRLVKNLGTRADTVLGNHDLHLLAVACGARSLHRSDTLDAILEAEDREDLLQWLRRRPMAIELNDGLLVHAGVFANWDKTKTRQLAQEIEIELRGDNWQDLLSTMYGNTPTLWNDHLQGTERQRCIINALTRMRFCHADGSMDFDLKEGAAKAPEHLAPWFDLTNRQTQDCTVIFGHWSTLGLVLRENVISLDTGCVWGGQLTAVRLSDRLVLQVQSPQHQTPF
ncbi:symmetrical bis(5'-nucleosyl)-tetraphosphatase [Undibacterium seohonense]|uniref:bis(5'-nucleosyl)-tetraphosphatase (symmetrical) n=1 Tax=Undibacterium seohonense TaxID=1344950 RepID=A0ABR6XAI8_9BURK|nr:symmetrical bis(5'-nucleosyl)-tetraphosphatase [Undibacterium seohonense]MBC3809339.1 symmetrical bis(5'-nucleosyl)-tetraphosphatase [Undibacterium seohonense]